MSGAQVPLANERWSDRTRQNEGRTGGFQRKEKVFNESIRQTRKESKGPNLEMGGRVGGRTGKGDLRHASGAAKRKGENTGKEEEPVLMSRWKRRTGGEIKGGTDRNATYWGTGKRKTLRRGEGKEWGATGGSSQNMGEIGTEGRAY